MQSTSNRLVFARGIVEINRRLGCVDNAMANALREQDLQRFDELDKCKRDLLYDRRMLFNCMR